MLESQKGKPNLEASLMNVIAEFDSDEDSESLVEKKRIQTHSVVQSSSTKGQEEKKHSELLESNAYY